LLIAMRRGNDMRDPVRSSPLAQFERALPRPRAVVSGWQYMAMYIDH